MSYVIIENATGLTVLEIYSKSAAAKVNTDKYHVLPVKKYLSNLNKQIKEEERYRRLFELTRNDAPITQVEEFINKEFNGYIFPHVRDMLNQAENEDHFFTMLRAWNQRNQPV